MVFIDTNYFVRLFVDDRSAHHAQANAFFLDASMHTDTYMSSTLAIFEVYWVLKRFYKLEKPRLVEAIEKILKMDFIDLLDRIVLLKALSRFSDSSLEFEDCFHLEIARDARCTGIATFDTKLSRAFHD